MLPWSRTKATAEKASTLVTLAGYRPEHWPRWSESHIPAGLSYWPRPQPYPSLLCFSSVLFTLLTNSDLTILAPRLVDSAAPALILDPASNGAQNSPVFKSPRLQRPALASWTTLAWHFLWNHTPSWDVYEFRALNNLTISSDNFLKRNELRHGFNILIKVLYSQAFWLRHLGRSDRILAGLGCFS